MPRPKCPDIESCQMCPKKSSKSRRCCRLSQLHASRRVSRHCIITRRVGSRKEREHERPAEGRQGNYSHNHLLAAQERVEDELAGSQGDGGVVVSHLVGVGLCGRGEIGWREGGCRDVGVVCEGGSSMELEMGSVRAKFWVVQGFEVNPKEKRGIVCVLGGCCANQRWRIFLPSALDAKVCAVT